MLLRIRFFIVPMKFVLEKLVSNKLILCLFDSCLLKLMFTYLV